VKVLKNWWVRYVVSLLLLVAAHLYYGGYFCWIPLAKQPEGWKSEPIGDFLDQTWQGKSPAPNDWMAGKGLVWVSGFKGGYEHEQILSLWESRDSALKRILNNPKYGWRQMEAVEVGVATNVTNYNHELIDRDVVGLWGLLIRCSSGDLCLAPAQFCRRGQFPDGQSLKYIAERHVLRQAKFQASSWVLRHDRKYKPTLMVRGEDVVEAVTRERIAQAAQETARFQQRNQETQDYLLPYSYSLASGAFSEEGRNLTKVCLGSLSLARYAALTEQEQDRLASQNHLRAMISRFGHQTPKGAYVSDGEQAPLGAQALLALALNQQNTLHPDRFFKDFEDGLARTLAAARQTDGHFSTACPVPKFSTGTPVNSTVPELSILKDETQNDQPAMALSYLATRCNDKNFPVQPKSVDESLDFYLKRFKRHPQPNGVPWLANAYSVRFHKDKNALSSQSAFYLVDWNLDNLQEWKDIEPQLKGSLFDPNRLQYGKECATADVGAHLLSLVQSEAMANSLGDQVREARYTKHLLSMSRYLVQMQVRSRSDLYWLATSQRQTALGGLRDAPWGPSMQIDSSAAALLAWSQWLARPKH
jgi:hypothetical protein